MKCYISMFKFSIGDFEPNKVADPVNRQTTLNYLIINLPMQDTFHQSQIKALHQSHLENTSMLLLSMDNI